MFLHGEQQRDNESESETEGIVPAVQGSRLDIASYVYLFPSEAMGANSKTKTNMERGETVCVCVCVCVYLCFSGCV